MKNGGVLDDFRDRPQELFEFFHVNAFLVFFACQQIDGFLKELSVVLVDFLYYLEVVVVEGVPAFRLLGNGFVGVRVDEMFFNSEIFIFHSLICIIILPIYYQSFHRNQDSKHNNSFSSRRL